MRRFVFPLVCALLLLGLPGHAQKDVDPTTAKTASLTGRVLDGDDRPVAGATVHVRGHGGDNATTDPLKATTDEAGAFVTPEVTGETFEVRVEAAGHGPASKKKIAGDEELTFTLEPGVSLNGTVHDAGTGAPISGIRVRGCDETIFRFPPELCPSVETDDKGRFKLVDLAAGRVMLRAVGEAHEERYATQVAPADEAMEIFLGPGGTIAGTVRDVDGNPLESVLVTAVLTNFEMSADGRGWRPKRANTDEAGRFELEGLPADKSYELTLAKKDWARATEGPLTLERGARHDLSVVLRQGATLTFKLTDEDEQVVRGDVEVRTTPAADEAGISRMARYGTSVADDDQELDAEGVWHVRNLVPGRFTVAIEPDGYATIERELRFANGKTVDLGTLVVDRGRTIAGRVTDTSGEPIAEAAVEVSWRSDDRRRWRTTKSDEDGRYEIAGLDESEWIRAGASADGYVRESPREVSLGDTVDFVLQPGARIGGRVEVFDGSAPRGAQVQAHPDAGGGAQSPFGRSSGRNMTGVSQDGAFKIDGIAPGSYTVEALAEGLAPTRVKDVRVGEGEQVDVGTLVLEEGLRLRGRVVSAATGQGVPGAQIQLHRGGQALRMAFAATATQGTHSSTEGSFEIDGLEPGSFRVAALHRDYSSAEKTLTVEAGIDPTVELTLGAGGRLTGTVRDAEGRLVPGATIMATLPTGGGMVPKSATTGADGSYLFEQLAPGTYIVMRTPDGVPDMSRMDMKNATIAEGETTVVDFGEEPAIRVRGRVLRGGAPVPEATLMFILGADSQTVAGVNLKSARSDAGGGYEIGLEAPGRYQVMVQRPGASRSATTVGVEVPEGPEVDLDIVLPAAGIDGTVVDSSGQPVAGARLVAVRDGVAPNVMTGQQAGVSSADGSYTIDGLEPGIYRVTAVANEYAPAERYPVTVSADQGPRVDIEMQRGKMVRGQIVDPTGRPVAGALVVVSLANAQAGAAMPGQSDLNGRFEIVGPLEGAVDITVLSQGWAPRRLTGVVPGDEPLVIAMSGGGSLRVVVLDADGSPVAGVTVVPISADPTAAGLTMFSAGGAAVTDAEGSAGFSRLMPGGYRVEAPQRHDVQPVTVTVSDGEETVAELRLSGS